MTSKVSGSGCARVTNGDTPTDMTYRGPTQDERTTTATGSDVMSYEYDLLGIESESDASTSTEYFRTNEGKVIGFQQGSKTRYFVRPPRVGQALPLTSPRFALVRNCHRIDIVLISN